MYNVSMNHMQTTQTFSIKGIKALTIQKYKSSVKELSMADDVLKLSPAEEPLQMVYENLVVRYHSKVQIISEGASHGRCCIKTDSSKGTPTDSV